MGLKQTSLLSQFNKKFHYINLITEKGNLLNIFLFLIRLITWAIQVSVRHNSIIGQSLNILAEILGRNFLAELPGCVILVKQ